LDGTNEDQRRRNCQCHMNYVKTLLSNGEKERPEGREEFYQEISRCFEMIKQTLTIVNQLQEDYMNAKVRKLTAG
jgi:hypothetical protein